MRIGRLARSAALMLGAILALAGAVRAAEPEGIWTIDDRAAVKLFDCSGNLCGQVIWLRNPALRTPKICGRTIIWGLRQSGAGAWTDGWFFDPENGKTYNVDASLAGPDTITANVYLGLPFLGRDETLRRTSLAALDGRC